MAVVIVDGPQYPERMGNPPYPSCVPQVSYLIANSMKHLIGPLTEEEFFCRYWERRALLIKEKVSAWPFSFDRKAFFDAIVSCSHVKMAFTGPGGQHMERPISGDQSEKCFEDGYTICASQLEIGHLGLRKYIQTLEGSLPGATFHFNGYLSPGGKGFGIHFDNHSVWILQIAGAKRWFFGDEPAVRYPITNCVYPIHRPYIKFPWYMIQRPDEARLNEVVLEPGDVLYLPAGVWHKTQANGYSLSLTLAQEAIRTTQFLSETVMARAFSNENSRRFLLGQLITEDPQAASEAHLEDVFGDALQVMRKALDELSPDQLFSLWKAHMEAKKRARRRKALQGNRSHAQPEQRTCGGRA